MPTNFNYISNELRAKKECGAAMNHHFEDELGVTVLENGYIGNFVSNLGSCGCAMNSKRETLPDAPWTNTNEVYDFENTATEHKTVIYVGHLQNCFGHYITDDLRKMWFLKTDKAETLMASGVEVVYTANKPPLLPVAFEIFKMAGVHAKFILIDKLTQFDMIFVPDNCFAQRDGKKMQHNLWDEMITTIRSNFQTIPSPCLLVYLTRTGFKSRKKEYGESELEDVFRKKGYTIVSPEILEIREQIQLMRDCKSLVVTEGSVAHLSLFCQPRTKVTILCKANYRNGYQEVINEYADLNVTYVEAHHSVMADRKGPWNGPFYLCVTSYLERFVGHPIPHIPYFLRYSYWQYKRNIPYRAVNKLRKMLGRAGFTK